MKYRGSREELRAEQAPLHTEMAGGGGGKKAHSKVPACADAVQTRGFAGPALLAKIRLRSLPRHPASPTLRGARGTCVLALAAVPRLCSHLPKVHAGTPEAGKLRSGLLSRRKADGTPTAPGEVASPFLAPKQPVSWAPDGRETPPALGEQV